MSYHERLLVDLSHAILVHSMSLQHAELLILLLCGFPQLKLSVHKALEKVEAVRVAAVEHAH